MTLKEFVEALSNELKENPQWADRKLVFNSLDRFNLEYLSIYSDDSQTINIDIGTEGD